MSKEEKETLIWFK